MAKFKGTGGDDLITGTADADTIAGNAGNDSISGGRGNDFILGNGGDDTISGNQGNDVIYGGSGNDTLNGNRANDFLSGDGGSDILTGNGGADTFAFNVRSGLLGDGFDTITDYDNAEGDVIDIVNGDASNAFAVQNGDNAELYYNDGAGSGDVLIGIAIDTDADNVVFI